MLAFDPAEIGLPELPQPMASAADFQTTLDLIDARIAELESALEAVTAAAESAATEAAARASPVDDGDDVSATDPATAQDAGAADATGVVDGEATPSALEATATRITQRLELLRELRLAVQRRATLHDRLATIEREVAQRQEQLARIAQAGPDLEPPYLISRLDQLRAETALKQTVETMAQTHVLGAKQRMSTAQTELSSAIGARREARDRLAAAQGDALSTDQLEAIEADLELARLNELLARQRLAAVEETVELARNDTRLAEAQQALLAAQRAFLEERAELPREAPRSTPCRAHRDRGGDVRGGR
jgi:hypothetical protein